MKLINGITRKEMMFVPQEVLLGRGVAIVQQYWDETSQNLLPDGVLKILARLHWKHNLSRLALLAVRGNKTPLENFDLQFENPTGAEKWWSAIKNWKLEVPKTPEKNIFPVRDLSEDELSLRVEGEKISAALCDLVLFVYHRRQSLEKGEGNLHFNFVLSRPPESENERQWWREVFGDLEKLLHLSAGSLHFDA